MRQFNERTILQALRLHGPTPKAELARLTRLSKQTVGTIVDRLLADGLLLKQARIRGGIGQPSVPLALNPDGAFGIGVQLGRRSLEVLVADFVGQVRYRHSLQYEAPDPQRLLPHIEQELRGVRRRWAAQWPRVSGVGLAAPRDMHLWTEVLGPAAAPVLARWQGVDLLATVQRMVDVPVVLARDTLAACAAELWQGHGQTCANFLYIFVGTFVGGGVVLGGHIMGGLHGNAGAIGSMPLGRSERADAAQLLEVASVWSLERALQERGWDSQRALGDAEVPAPVADVVQAWLLRAGDALAMTVTTAAAMLDVDAVIIDASLPPALLQALVSSVQSQLGHYRWWGLRPPRVMAGRVGRHARALGGALLPLHAAFFPDRAVFLKPQE
ncbi:ROK family transcriptional regulator [Tepidimonas taiwanensis]|nr:ROK family transcriptional regulator [Tepidimonas taiwanensis]